MFDLYMDDDSETLAVLRGLRVAGGDVIRSTDSGMRGALDIDHLRFAAAEGRALYSANRGDFSALHATSTDAGEHHAGIILRGPNRSIGAQIRGLLALQELFGPEEMADRIEWLTRTDRQWLR